MRIENKGLHGTVWLIQLVATILYVLFIFSVYLTSFFRDHLPAVAPGYVVAGGGILYLMVLFAPNFLKLHYIFYSDDGDKLVIKTYPVGLFTSSRHTYLIPKKDFARAELKYSLWGLRRALLIYQWTGKHLAKYPPLYINSLPQEDQKRILLSLSGMMVQRGAAAEQV